MRSTFLCLNMARMGLMQIGNNAFSGKLFYDKDRTTILEISELPGYSYKLIDGKMIRQSSRHIDVNYITFDAAEGYPTGEQLMVDADGRLASLPEAPVRAGYNFLGWYTMEDGGEKVTTSTVFAGDSTVYAHWEYVDSDPSLVLIITAVVGLSAAAFMVVRFIR